ncbi:DUF1758 domain-containing protein [Trichonephila clavipes]|nr:DUF1758 domain-containing protein [Trichonephila clavipes]
MQIPTKKMNNAAPVPIASEMRNVMKISIPGCFPSTGVASPEWALNQKFLGGLFQAPFSPCYLLTHVGAPVAWGPHIIDTADTAINLDKIAEDYCEIEIFESLEIIQLDIEDINQRIETTEVGLKLLMYSLKNSENVNINLNDNGKNSIRLPQIPLPEFSGVIAEFSYFKNQFINLISNNEQLNDSQKLYYLRASLKGETKLLESPSDSFDSLFKALEDRYENKRQLIDSHVLEITNYEKFIANQPKNCAL